MLAVIVGTENIKGRKFFVMVIPIHEFILGVSLFHSFIWLRLLSCPNSAIVSIDTSTAMKSGFITWTAHFPWDLHQQLIPVSQHTLPRGLQGFTWNVIRLLKHPNTIISIQIIFIQENHCHNLCMQSQRSRIFAYNYKYHEGVTLHKASKRVQLSWIRTIFKNFTESAWKMLSMKQKRQAGYNKPGLLLISE